MLSILMALFTSTFKGENIIVRKIYRALANLNVTLLWNLQQSK